MTRQTPERLRFRIMDNVEPRDPLASRFMPSPTQEQDPALGMTRFLYIIGHSAPGEDPDGSSFTALYTATIVIGDRPKAIKRAKELQADVIQVWDMVTSQRRLDLEST